MHPTHEEEQLGRALFEILATRNGVKENAKGWVDLSGKMRRVYCDAASRVVSMSKDQDSA